MTTANQSTSTNGSESCNTMIVGGGRSNTVTFILPAYWASYLINGDASSFWFDEGGPNAVMEAIDQWMKAEGVGDCLDCSEQGFFVWHPDFPHQHGATCLEFTFSLHP